MLREQSWQLKEYGLKSCEQSSFHINPLLSGWAHGITSHFDRLLIAEVTVSCVDCH